jgi:predicted dehydrogenase
MLSLAGPVAEVAALGGTSRMHRMETEDFVGAGLRFANGAFGSLLATTACYPGAPERLVCHRDERHRDAGGRARSRWPTRTAGASGTARRLALVAAPTRWPSRTTGTRR